MTLVVIDTSEKFDVHFRNRSVHVFSNIYKFKNSKMPKEEWCKLYNLSISDFDFALNQIDNGFLTTQYNNWVDKESEQFYSF